MIKCEDKALIEALVTTYKLGDSSVSAIIRDQDVLVKQIWEMSSGISQKLPRLYKAAMKSEEADL